MQQNRQNASEDNKKKTYRRDINKGYVILYLGVFILIIIGEIVLYRINGNFSVTEFAGDIIGNLMGVLAAFLVFDIAHEKISKDSYASEVSEQILDTLMYHPEAMELYENEQKKKFVSAFVESILEDDDAGDMVNHFLNTYLLTKQDFENRKTITEKDCRIRTSFSYRFVLETERTLAFSSLKAQIRDKIDPMTGKSKRYDPYFYVQEELNYRVKYLNNKGNNTCRDKVKIGFIYDNAALDKFLRGNKAEENDELLTNCLFRESLDLEDADKKMFNELPKDELVTVVKTMFRPHLNIDRHRGEVVDVQLTDSGIFVEFKVEHDQNAMEHAIDIVFHIPKKWDTLIEVALVEPTKAPLISLSYNEDFMDVDMYSFLNKGETSSYANTSESENGVYSISLNDEWVFPISGAVFPVKRDAGTM